MARMSAQPMDKAGHRHGTALLAVTGIVIVSTTGAVGSASGSVNTLVALSVTPPPAAEAPYEHDGVNGGGRFYSRSLLRPLCSFTMLCRACCLHSHSLMAFLYPAEPGAALTNVAPCDKVLTS